MSRIRQVFNGGSPDRDVLKLIQADRLREYQHILKVHSAPDPLILIELAADLVEINELVIEMDVEGT